MSEKKNKVVRPIVRKEKSHPIFPKGLILFSLVMIGVAIADYLNYYSIPREALDGLLLVAGLWMLKIGIAIGFYNKHHEIIKRYV